MSEQAYQPTDRRPIRSRESRWARAVAHRLAIAQVSPTGIAMLGMTAAIAAGVAFAFTDCQCGLERALWIGGAALILLRLLSNMFDGMVAIERRMASRVGELYNEVPDRVSDTAVLIGAGYSQGGGVELGYAAACVALFVAYVRTTAKSAGAPGDFRGPMAKQQRMFIVVIAAIFMGVTPATWRFAWGPRQGWGIMAAILAVVVLGGALTAARRLRRAIGILRE